MNNERKTNAVKTIKETLIPLAGVVLAVLNIWLAGKLAPIAQDLAVLESRVSANERDVESIGARLEKRLDSLELKLDEALIYIYQMRN